MRVYKMEMSPIGREAVCSAHLRDDCTIPLPATSQSGRAPATSSRIDCARSHRSSSANANPIHPAATPHSAQPHARDQTAALPPDNPSVCIGSVATSKVTPPPPALRPSTSRAHSRNRRGAAARTTRELSIFFTVKNSVTGHAAPARHKQAVDAAPRFLRKTS